MENGATSGLERIERALARIDDAIARPAQASVQQRDLAELAARHDALRNETRRALEDLDTLLGRSG